MSRRTVKPRIHLPLGGGGGAAPAAAGGGAGGGPLMPQTITLATGNTVVAGGHTHQLSIAPHTTDPAAHHAPVTLGNTGLSLSGQQLSLRLATVSGLSISSGLRLDDSVAGDGLAIANKVLAVGAGDGIDVSANAIAVDVTDLIGSGLVEEATNNIALNTPGTLSVSSPNAAAGNHTHAVTALASTMSGEEALLKSSEAGGLALASLQTSGAVDVGQGLTAGGSGFRVIHHTHDYPHVHVVVNPGTYWNLDEQFGVDIDDSLLVRGYIVGKHALQVADAAMICHFDGPEPYETNYTGNPTGHMGQVATATGGVIYRPGKFGKAVQVAEATTNLVTNPSFEVDGVGWIGYQSGVATTGTRGTSNEEARFGTSSFRMEKTGGENSDRWGVRTPIAVVSGQTYTISAYVKITATSGGLGRFRIYVEGAVPITSLLISGVTDWTRQTITVTATTTGTMQVYFWVDQASTMTVYIDGVQVEAKAYPTPYCDGSLGAGHAWTGTAHASTSTRAASHLRYDDASSAIRHDQGSIMMWVNPSEDVSSKDYLSAYGGSGRHILMRVRPNNIVECCWGLNQRAGGYAPVGEWTHIAMTRTADGMLTVYVNGEEVISGSAGEIAPVSDIVLGRASWDYINYANGCMDDLVIVKRALSADEIRAVYESNAPVFAETSTWHWRAGRNLVWADAEGLWAVDETGDPTFAVSGTTKSWGGANLGAGDVFIGNVGQGHYLHWDDSAAQLTIRGDVAITGSVSVAWDEITNKPDGAGRLGTGTIPPSAGLWLTGSYMGYYNGSAWPVWIDNQGRFAFGNSTGTQYVKWDGSTFSIVGNGSGITSINGGNIQTGTVTATQIASRTITAGKIVSGTITANEIASKTITADRLNVTTLSAIAADLGSVTAGTVTGATIQTASSGNRVVMNNADLTVQQSGEAVYLTKWKNSSITGFADAWGFINLQKTNPLSQTTGMFNVGYSMDASNETILAMYRGGVDVTLSYAGSWHTAAHFTMNGVAINGGLGVNIAYTPGAGDINAGRYLRTDGNRVIFGTPDNPICYLYRSGNDIYWWNGSTGIKLN